MSNAVVSNHPEISVVMSVYNNEDTLREALDSVLSQTGVALECIVINDGSRDSTPSILDAYARQDKRVHILHHANQGLTRALMAGCAMARAPWIARQDADDVSLPGRLTTLLQMAKDHPEVGMVATSVRLIGPRGEDLGAVRHVSTNESANDQILEKRIGPPAHGCAMFSRKLYQRVGGYRAAFYYGQDSDLWLRMAELAPIIYTDEVLYAYRIGPEAISGGMRAYQKKFGRLGRACLEARKKGHSEEPFLAEAAQLTETLRTRAKYKASRWNKARSCYHIACLLEAGNRSLSLTYLRQAIQCHPLYFRAWIKCWLSRRVT